MIGQGKQFSMDVKKLAKFIWIVYACALAAAQAQAQSQGPVITVAWRDKAPYHYTENGVDKGILLERMKKVFAAAGIRTVWAKEPSKRIWANFQAGATRYCSIGWYLLDERAALANFSVPIMIDRPHQILTSPEAAHRVAGHPSLASLMADRELHLGVVDGVSYGAAIDALIQRSANRVLRRTVETGSLMRMTRANRVDFMFVDQDDWEFAQQNDPALRGSVLIDFPDMPAGLQRYVACSKDVGPAVMARLNRAIVAAQARAPKAR